MREGRYKDVMADISIYDMGLSARPVNCLRRAGILTLEDLLFFIADGPEKLLEIRDLGKKSYEELMKKMGEYGIL